MKLSKYANDRRAEYRELRFVIQLREDLLNQVCHIHTCILSRFSWHMVSVLS